MSGTWDSGWVTGDVVPTAEFKKGIGATRDVTLGVDTASFDIQTIPSGYAHLLIVAQLRSTTAATASSSGLRFNNDSTANHYHWQYQDEVTGTGSGADAGTGDTVLQLGAVPAANSLANSFGAVSAFIPNYTGTTALKSLEGTSYSGESATFGVGFGRLRTFGGTWNSNAAITRVTVLPGAGNWKAGSRLTLYVMGA